MAHKASDFVKLILLATLTVCVLFMTGVEGRTATVSLDYSAVNVGQTVRASWTGFTDMVNVYVLYSSGTPYATASTTNTAGYQDLNTTGWPINSYYVKVEQKSNTAIYATSPVFSVNPMPDLAAVSVWLSSISTPGTELTSPKVGDNVYINFQFRVDNASVYAPIKINGYLDGSSVYSASYSPVTPTGTYNPSTQTYSYYWTVTADQHTIQWVLDDVNQVKETNESNNSLSRTYNILNQIDLVAGNVGIKDGSGNNASGFVGQTVYFSFDYSMVGQGTSAPFNISCELDGSPYWTQYNVTATQGSYSISAPTGFLVTNASHTVTWRLDPSNNIQETNESNNVSSTGWTPVLVSPQVTVSPTSGVQGTTFSQPGTGFTPNGGVTLHFTGPDGPSTASETAGADGAYEHFWTCDACPDGTYTYYAVDDATGQWSNTVTFTVYGLNPQVSVSPNSGPQGTTFSQPGTGFTPNSGVTLHFVGPDGESTATETTDGTGAYSHSWLCDACPVGEYSYYAADNATGQSSNTVTFTVEPQIAATPFLSPLYRGYSSDDTDHFYTTNPVERDAMPDSGYTYEKVEAYISNRAFEGGVPLHRLYNSTTKSHYYTTSDTERDTVLANPDWEDEKEAGYVYPNHADYLVPMYHLYSATADDHFYTISEFERSNAIESFGYQDMGVAFYAARNSSAAPLAGKPVARRGGVDLSSGNFVPYRNHVDFANPAGFGLPFVFARTYNSGNSGEAGPLGSGWTHSYQIRIIDLGGIAIVKWGNGRDDLYVYNGTAYTPAPGVYNQLQKTFGSYILTTKDKTIYTFASLPLGAPEDGLFVGRLVEIKDRNGIELELVYDDVKEGLLDHVIDGSNRTYQFHYIPVAGDPSHLISESNRYRLSGITEENAGGLNRSIGFGYDVMSRLTSYTDAEGNITSYAYEDADNPGLLTKITLPELNTITADYNGDKLDTLEIGSGENVEKTIHLIYNTPIQTPNGSVEGTQYIVQPAGGPGQTVSVTHDQQYKLGIVKDGLNNLSEVLQYDNNLNPIQIKDKKGLVWFYSWNSATGNLTGVVNPENEVTNYQYDPNEPNNLIRITDPALNVTKFEYDDYGNVKKIIHVVDGTDRETIITRDGNGQILSVTTPSNNLNGIVSTATFTYDAYGYLQTITDPEGKTAAFDFDEGGRLLSRTDPDLVSINYTYYPLNRVKTAKDMLDRVTSYTYDGNGNLDTIKDPRNIVTDYDYTDRDLVETVTQAGVRIAKYGYDESARRTRVTNAMERTWENSFDQAGNLRSSKTPLGLIDYFHDYYPDGSLQKQVDRTSRETSYAYDGAGRMTHRTIAGGNYYEYEYWPNSLLKAVLRNGGQIGSFQYDASGNLTAYTDAFGQTVNYTYHPGGNLKTIQYPGNKMVTYNYNLRNLLSTVCDWQNRTTTYSYTDAGRLKKIAYPNGAYVEYAYDAYFRLKTVSNKKPDGSVIVEYTVDEFDELDVPRQVTTTGGISATHPALSESYVHDANNRITSAGGTTFTHNDMGELLSQTRNGVATNFTWDSDDLPGRLKSINVSGASRSFEYDGLGNRIAATREEVITRYVLDLSGSMANVLAETDGSNNVNACYIHGLGIISRILPDNTAVYYHFDRQGNVVALTDESGNVTDQYAYDADPFGFAMTRQGSTDNPFTFVGRYGVMDEGDNLFYMRARYYNAETGRFLNEDPIGFGGGDLNLYAYVGGNPVVGIDPIGLFDLKKILKNIGDIAGELSGVNNWINDMKVLESFVDSVDILKCYQSRYSEGSMEYLRFESKINAAKEEVYIYLTNIVKKYSYEAIKDYSSDAILGEILGNALGVISTINRLNPNGEPYTVGDLLVAETAGGDLDLNDPNDKAISDMQKNMGQ